MESLTSGTLAGTGSFRCEQCGYVVTLAGSDELPACPGCSGSSFVRSSLFSAGRFQRRSGEAPTAEERAELVAAARAQITEPGEYLAYEDAGRPRVVALSKEWTRVGRSLAADVRFDDPTVSRRHALVHCERGAVRIGSDVRLRDVASAHVDDAEAEPDVTAAVSVVLEADLGSEDAQFVVDQAEGHELAWYATQEIGPLLELL